MAGVIALGLVSGALACRALPVGSVGSVEPIPIAQNQPPYRAWIRGRAAVVDLWAAWCAPCVRAIPALRRLSENHDPKTLVVVGVNVGESQEDVQRFVREAQVGYAVYRDPDFRFADSLGETQIPRILLLDGTGRVVARANGLDPAFLTKIEEILVKP